MTPDEFRRYGRLVVDRIADYWERVESLPVRSRVAPGEVAAALPAHPPETGEPVEALLADLDRVILPGLTHWQHPAFFAYFPANASGPAVLGDLLSSGLGVQGMLWATSPAATELETVVLDWLAELLDLPDRVPRRTASSRTPRPARCSARCWPRCTGLRRRGPGGGRGATGTRCTSPPRRTRRSRRRCGSPGSATPRCARCRSTRRRWRCGRTRCAAAVRADLAAGVRPVLVVATRRHHLDHRGRPGPRRSARLCRRQRGSGCTSTPRTPGWRRSARSCAGSTTGWSCADSYATNPHKWLLTSFDCDAFWVADPDALVGALTVLPEFLRNAATESGAVIDYRDWQVPLGRRFRALKLWAVLRWYGAEGLRAHIRTHVEPGGRVRRPGPGRPALRGGRAAPAVAGLLPAAAPATAPRRICWAR